MSPRPQNSLKRISAKLGVSMTTVSRVLSGQAGKYRISEETAKAILDYARKENFTPNPIAKGLRLRKTSTIGLVIADVSNPFFASIASEITRATRDHGYSIILCDSQENLAIEKQSIELLWNRQVDGMIICPVGQSSAHLVRHADERRRIVLVDRVFPDIGLPCVSSDNFSGGKLATGHLLDHGHRRIACLQGLSGTSTSQARVKGYEAALTAHGVPFDPALVVGDSFDEQGGYLDTKLLLSTSPDITALLALSNLLALGALRALTEENRRVPEDVSIIAFDDQPFLAHLAPPLTTVAQSARAMGGAAVKILFERMRVADAAGAPHHAGLLLPVSLITRKSVHRLG
jgi:LacI family transcriptional regulator